VSQDGGALVAVFDSVAFEPETCACPTEKEGSRSVTRGTGWEREGSRGVFRFVMLVRGL
jgi:hypothetical protein